MWVWTSNTEMRQEVLSGLFEVCDEPMISPVIYWQKKEEGRLEWPRAGREQKQTNGGLWNDICEYY